MTADTTSPLLQLLIMGDGLHNGDWGDQTNTNLLKIEQAIAGTSVIDATQASPITLTSNQTRPGILIFTGALTANVTIVLPAISDVWQMINQTTGGFAVILSSAGGGSACILDGRQTIVSDGTNIFPLGSSIPVGTVFEYYGTTLPSGAYLWANGQAVSRTAYSALFAALGTTYGVGNGSTTFNLPNRQEVVAIGTSGMGGATSPNLIPGSTLGLLMGASTITLTIAQMPSHAHGVSDPTHIHGINDPTHLHSYTQSFLSNTNEGGGSGGAKNAGGQTSGTGGSGTGVSVASHATGISIQNQGGGGSHSNVQPTIVCNFIIRAS